MKNTQKTEISFLSAIIFAGIFFLASCKKDSSNNNDNTDVLIEANNNKSLGKYSGILIGSSGYYTIEIRTSGSKATIVFDGATYKLDGKGVIEDNKAITNYIFQKDNIKITFSVSADGKSPGVKIEIPGHKVYATINKETTVYKTENYIGKIRDSIYQRDIEPAAITISNNIITGFARIDTQHISISGQRIDTTSKLNILFSNQPGKTYNATLNGDMINGGNLYIFNMAKVK